MLGAIEMKNNLNKTKLSIYRGGQDWYTFHSLLNRPIPGVKNAKCKQTKKFLSRSRTFFCCCQN